MIFQRIFFWLNKFEADWETRKALGGFGGMLSWKFTCCNGYFNAFWITFRQILFQFFDLNSECFAKYDAFRLHIFDYACLGRNCHRRSSKLWKNCMHQKHFWKWLVGGYHLSYPPGSAPGHKLQKPLKESGMFQSHGTIGFVRFHWKAESNGEANAQCPPPPLCKYAPAWEPETRSLWTDNKLILRRLACLQMSFWLLCLC